MGKGDITIIGKGAITAMAKWTITLSWENGPSPYHVKKETIILIDKMSYHYHGKRGL